MITLVLLEQFTEQLLDPLFRNTEGSSAHRSCRVEFSVGLAMLFLRRVQKSFAFHAVQKGIEGSSTDLVSVPSQLFDHAEPENRLFGGVVKNMEADQPRIEGLVYGGVRSVLVLHAV